MQKIEVGDPRRVRGHTVVPVEKTEIHLESYGAGVWCYGSKHLVALVVQSATGVRAYDQDGGNMTMNDLRNIAPDIEAYLGGLTNDGRE